MRASFRIGRRFSAWPISVWLLFFLALASAPSSAQESLGVRPGGTPPLELPEYLQKEKPGVETPQPSLPDSTPEEPREPKGGQSILVREIRVEGNTVFTHGELHKIAAPYVGRRITSRDLESLRRALTVYYVDRGYINSGAVIPDQDVTHGIITFRIVEGELSNVEATGNKWLRSGYYRDRIALGAKKPLNIHDLQERLQLLQQDDRILLIHAELRPGLKPGESELKLDVEENLPFSASVGFNNYQIPTVGSEQGFVTLTDRSLTGRGDVLSFTYAYSSGANPQIDTWYSIPLTAGDTSLMLRYVKNEDVVLEEPFEPLDITSESDVYEITLRHPFYRSVNQEFAVALTGAHLESQTYLLGEPFSFTPGMEDGESVVTAVRLTPEWFYRTRNQVVAARSRFSFGVDALGATINESSLPDGRYFAWLGQFQWARILGDYGIQAVFRTDVQLASEPLLPVEQIPVGGRYSVRGYRENYMVRDNGLIVSLESRIPLVRNKSWADYLQLAPFWDFGMAWNNKLSNTTPDEITSLGLGLRWAMTLVKEPFPVVPQFEIYWGYPLLQPIPEGDNLQDIGVHLQFTVAAF